MALDEQLIIDSFSRHDMHLAEISSGIIDLVHANPFSERLIYLLNNQDLAAGKVVNLKGIVSEPNCIGTALFIAGVSELNYPYHGYSSELNPHMKEPVIERSSMARIANMFSSHLERRIPGAFAFSYSVEIDDWHAGVYLGEVDGVPILFAQHGHKGKFGPESLRNYSCPTYYIPLTLNVER